MNTLFPQDLHESTRVYLARCAAWGKNVKSDRVLAVSHPVELFSQGSLAQGVQTHTLVLKGF